MPDWGVFSTSPEVADALAAGRIVVPYSYDEALRDVLYQAQYNLTPQMLQERIASDAPFTWGNFFTTSYQRLFGTSGVAGVAQVNEAIGLGGSTAQLYTEGALNLQGQAVVGAAGDQGAGTGDKALAIGGLAVAALAFFLGKKGGRRGR